MKKVVAVVAGGLLCAIVHDMVLMRKETGKSVKECAKELAKRTKEGFVQGFWIGYWKF